MGAWTLKNYEICLLGTKGAMLKYKKVNNIPQKVRENIELLFGGLPRIELFARKKTNGWDAWGNEV